MKYLRFKFDLRTQIPEISLNRGIVYGALSYIYCTYVCALCNLGEIDCGLLVAMKSAFAKIN